MIRIGSAGWSYPDWDGVVYPEGAGKRFDALKYLASFVDCIEINTSFYRIPPPPTAASWIRRIAGRDSFRFTVKLWRGFTHDSERLTATEAREAAEEFRDFLAPIHEAGRLGAILVQLPYSFHATTEGLKTLQGLLDRFEAYPLVVEVRHGGWLTDDFLAGLHRRGVGFCNIDQPALASNIPPTAHVTSEIAYVRLHGRNADAWFEQDAGRDRRYDYLYGAEELAGWVDRITTLAAGARDVFVIANNHYRGKGVVNALELKARIEKDLVEVPPDLLELYPRLAAVARPDAAGLPGRRPRQGALPLS